MKAKSSLAAIHAALGIPGDYALRRGLRRYAEADELVDVGLNIMGHMQRLTPAAAQAWAAMQTAAAGDSVALLIVSGFRSIAYQVELIQKKLTAGTSIDQILEVNAAPGFSEHHTGCAIDVATPGSRPLTEAFEATPAFTWLRANAVKFGFRLPYDRGNRHGFCYEPWHWSQLTT